MIIFEFKFNKKELAMILEDDVSTIHRDYFLQTFIVLPVRFNIHGVELFRFEKPSPRDYFTRMAIMGFASTLLVELRSLPKTGKASFTLIQGTTFDFQMLSQNRVSIKFGNQIHLIVLYDELLMAFEQFAVSVRKFLNEHVPQMHEHPYWGRWLRGEFE